jgi:hypothetical protein
MAFPILQHKGASSASGTVAVTLDSSVTAGSALIALCYSYTADTDYAVASDVDGAFTNNLAYWPNLQYRSIAFSHLNCTSGTHTVTLSGGSTNSTIHVYEVSGVVSSSAYDKGVGSNPEIASGSCDPTDTDTTSQADEIVFGFIHGAEPGTLSGANYDHSQTTTDTTYNRNAISGAKIVSSAGAYGPAFEASSNGVACHAIVVTYKAAAAASSPSSSLSLLGVG